MPALLGHNAFTYYAQNYAGIIRMSLACTPPTNLQTAIALLGEKGGLVLSYFE